MVESSKRVFETFHREVDGAIYDILFHTSDNDMQLLADLIPERDPKPGFSLLKLIYTEYMLESSDH